MKLSKLTFLIILGITFQNARGDEGLRPSDYTFVVASPLRQYLGVQMLHSWEKEADQLKFEGWFKMIEGKTGKVLWSSKELLGLDGSVFIPDDPDYTVSVDTWLSSDSVSGIRFSKLSEAPEEAQKKNLKLVAIRFFKKGKLISKFTLKELDVDPKSIQLSTSHLSFFEPQTEGALDLNWEIGVHTELRNPSFDSKDGTMNLTCRDGKTRKFDYRNGQLIEIDFKSAQKNEKSDPGIVDPFAD